MLVCASVYLASLVIKEIGGGALLDALLVPIFFAGLLLYLNNELLNILYVCVRGKRHVFTIFPIIILILTWYSNCKNMPNILESWLQICDIDNAAPITKCIGSQICDILSNGIKCLNDNNQGKASADIWKVALVIILMICVLCILLGLGKLLKCILYKPLGLDKCLECLCKNIRNLHQNLLKLINTMIN
ncbi:hypothetical protein Cyrtocomes_00512 [Candidatus Cyrtobacter comes]|uniref:Uncharacterized protein n=1 Tax=Candidatus Cyrtobacter comes TaxID=675776 RepID=A0ABU5L7P4_9RICK|nr:hypothetical protein [Candidatus Cyrtobacter comes]